MRGAHFAEIVKMCIEHNEAADQEEKINTRGGSERKIILIAGPLYGNHENVMHDDTCGCERAQRLHCEKRLSPTHFATIA
jgi:hypothetical protein